MFSTSAPAPANFLRTYKSLYWKGVLDPWAKLTHAEEYTGIGRPRSGTHRSQPDHAISDLSLHTFSYERLPSMARSILFLAQLMTAPGQSCISAVAFGSQLSLSYAAGPCRLTTYIAHREAEKHRRVNSSFK